MRTMKTLGYDDKSLLDWLETHQWHGGTIGSPQMSGETHRLQGADGNPVRGIGLRGAIIALIQQQNGES